MILVGPDEYELFRSMLQYKSIGTLLLARSFYMPA